jgi:hypothetical protein
MTGPAGARLSILARKLRGLPVTATAWVEGKLSAGQVETITAHLRDDTYVALFADHEGGVVPDLVGLSMHDTGVAMKQWRDKADAVIDRDQPVEQDRGLHHSRTLDGTWVTRAHFGTVDGEVISTALRVAATDDGEGEPARTPAQRRADAITDICRDFLDHHDRRPSRRHRPHLNVIVKPDPVNGGWRGELLDRTPICQTDLNTLVCDSIIHRYVTDDTSAVLDYGVGHPTIPTTLFNAVQTRDRGCRYPGCDRPGKWCDAHHLTPLNHNGPTNPQNLILLCGRHHHHIHRPGWKAQLTITGDLIITTPNGTTRTSRPPGTLTT